jgi:hypothetical protein
VTTTQQLLQLDPQFVNGTFERDPAWFFENDNRTDAMRPRRESTINIFVRVGDLKRPR